MWLPKSKMLLGFVVTLGTTSIAWAGPTTATTKSVPAANTVNESQYGFWCAPLPSNWKAVSLSESRAQQRC